MRQAQRRRRRGPRKKLTGGRLFLFDLALALGKSVNEIETTFGQRELLEWRIYAAKYPFGAYRDNLHAGLIASAIYNVNKGKKGKRLAPADFLLIKEQSVAAAGHRHRLMENRLKASLMGKKA